MTDDRPLTGTPSMVPEPTASGPPPDRRKLDRLKQLRAFCQAARFESVSQAAEEVLSSQPVVSRQIRSLEEELGTPLFDRGGSRLTLSPAGRTLHRLVRPLVEGMDRLPDTFAERHAGVVTGPLLIGAGQTTSACALPDYVKAFRARNPGVRVVVRVGGGRERLAWLRDYEVDVVFASVDVPPPGLEFHELFTSELVYITPLDHPLAGRPSVSFEEMASWPIVTHPEGRYVRLISELFTRLHGRVATIAVEIEGWHAIKTCVEAGLGTAVVPELCLYERNRLWAIPFSRYVPPRRYGMLVRRGGILPLAAKRFLEAAAAAGEDGGAGPGATRAGGG